MFRKIKIFGTLTLVCGSLAVLYGNCTPSHNVTTESSTSTFVPGTCSLSGPEHLFSLTYGPFLQSNCSTCHIPGGIGKGEFATSGLAVAFNAFSLVGYRKVSQYAVDPNHQSPYSGPQHTTQIAEIENNWKLGEAELAQCKNGTITEFIVDPWADVRVSSQSKAISPVLNTDVNVRWNLNTEMLTPPATATWPSMPGAYFQITLRANSNGTNTYYSILNPRIVYPTTNAQAVDLRVQSIRVKINGEEIINETTFHYVDAEARKNQTTTLSAGAMVALAPTRVSDVISVSFGKIETVVLPPPPPAPSIQFTSTSRTVNESGQVSIAVQLNQPVDSFVTASYSIQATSTARGYSTYNIVDENNMTRPIPRWDIDYTISQNAGGTVVFEPNVQTANIVLNIANDQRKETNETIIIRINSVDLGSQTGVVGTNSTHTVTITDDDTDPVPGEVTLSQLLSTGGPFNKHCIKCHHPDLNGNPRNQYSMVNHADLLSRNRFVPNDPNASLAWLRITGAVMPLMPLNGQLSVTDLQAYQDILSWIENGAKNN